MEAILSLPSSTSLGPSTRSLVCPVGVLQRRLPWCSALRLSNGCRRNSSLVVTAAKKKTDTLVSSNKKPKVRRIVNTDEIFYPEAALLKKEAVKEDDRVQPEFADADEEKLSEFLNLELESHLKVERMRHFEVVYLIHENQVDNVETIVQEVQDFIRERKGRIYRLNNWGMRRLAYSVKKTWHAIYILMNFELEAKSVNDFKTMLDKDERIIRHLVMKRKEAITKDCPPPVEYHTLVQADFGNFEDSEDYEDDAEYADDEEEEEEDDDDEYDDDEEEEEEDDEDGDEEDEYEDDDEDGYEDEDEEETETGFNDEEEESDDLGDNIIMVEDDEEVASSKGARASVGKKGKR